MVAVFAGVSEHRPSVPLTPAASGHVSVERESGKPIHLKTEPEEEHHSQAKVPKPSSYSVPQEKLPEQSTDISVTSDEEQSTGDSPTSSTQAVLTQLKPNVLGIFRESDQSTKVQSLKQEQVNSSKQTENGSTQNLFKGASDMTMDTPASVKPNAKISGMTDVKTLQITALQNTAFKETVTTADVDTQQKATEGSAVQFPEKVSNLKAFWERENTGPKIIFTREEAKHEDNTRAGVDTSRGLQSYVETNIQNNLSAQMKIPAEDTSERSQDKSLAQQIVVDLSKDDGTYRADPVLIYEETDDSLTISLKDEHISVPHENTSAPLSSSATHKQEGGSLVSSPRQSSSSLQENRPAKISQLKHFWEKEYAGPRVIVARVKESSNSSLLTNRESPPDLGSALDNRQKFEGDEETSPHRTRSSGILKSLNVTDKGFVSPERLQRRGPAGTGDVNATHSKGKAEGESEERPLSPQPHTSRSKDHEDEVRKSPSKTCHPRALPRESSSPKRSIVEGSPLKTFPIDINPQTKAAKEQQQKSTPVTKQRKSPLHEAKQILADTKPRTDIQTGSLPLHLEDTVTFLDNIHAQESSSSSSTSPQTKQALGKIFTHLARSFIPQDYQHYLGPQEKAHSPPFHQDKDAAADSDVVHRPQSALRESVGNQSERDLHTISSCAIHSSQETATRAWSLSRGSSDSELLNYLFISFFQMTIEN